MIGLLHERFLPSFRAGDSCHSIIIAIMRLIGKLLYTIEGLEKNKRLSNPGLWYMQMAMIASQSFRFFKTPTNAPLDDKIWLEKVTTPSCALGIL